MKSQLSCGRNLSVFLCCLLVCQIPVLVSGQTTSDILENGKRIDKSNEMRFKFQGDIISYQAFDKKRSSYFPLSDSVYFLSDDQVLIYFTTLNPLNYSVEGQVTVTDDALSKAEDGALGTIIDALKKMTPLAGGAGAAGDTASFDDVNGQLDALQAALDNDQKKAIAASFNQLKQISFDKPDDAKELLAQGKKDLDNFAAFYTDRTNQVADVQKKISRYFEKGPDPAHDPVLARDFFNRQFAELNRQLQTQLVWLNNLKKSYTLIVTAWKNSIKVDGELLTALPPVTVDRGKIANLSLAVSQDGMALSDDNDIVTAGKKVLATRVLRFRRFRHWVFEMAAGTAFTFIEYPKFGTATDSASGKTVVADGGKETFKRFNLTAMFNWNYYIPNSNIHPFIQMGVGANAEYPAFFLGAGLRFNSDGGSHFAIAGGFASSWVRTLNTLKIGSPVSGTAELEKDITYEFQWPLKPYIGIQYNF
ncbi:MAG TPA: hypothetical protein VGN00_13025 [Puia sp.]|jgi:hypothetical protein